MLSTIKEYTKLNKSLLHIIATVFFVQLINVSFVAILPLYMKAEHYTDAEYAHLTSYRYLGMLALALFLGMYIKGRKLLPMFYIAATGVPFFALLILIGVHLRWYSLLLFANLFWGISYTFIQIPILPYIMRNAPKEHVTSAITLNFATWSIASITGNLIIAILNWLNPSIFSERNLLFLITLLSFSAVYFILKTNKNEFIPVIHQKRSNIKEYDWIIIIRGLAPTTIIAIGAGFTVPFISLFFSSVHHMSTAIFSFLNFLAAILVTAVAIYVPRIKEQFGYQKAVPATQSFAIIALIIMATSQYYSYLSVAVYIAALFYVVRQPLMSTAVPMTSEITMLQASVGRLC